MSPIIFIKRCEKREEIGHLMEEEPTGSEVQEDQNLVGSSGCSGTEKMKSSNLGYLVEEEKMRVNCQS